jgi:6-phosphogluconolactonase (cycloisomerase 2 family)
MKLAMGFCLQRMIMALAGLCVVSGLALGSDTDHYVVTNDDAPPPLLNGISVYSITPDGQLTFRKVIQPGGLGIGGGFFGENRVRVLSAGNMQCVYFSEAGNGEIVGIVVDNGSVGGTATGSPTDGGISNGIGLAVNSQYLYASFTDSNTIGTFLLEPGCGLIFVNDISVAGLQGGVIDGMAVHGNMLIATYGDGSIESFNIAGGTPVSNGDEQNSTAAIGSQGATYPNGIDITEDGHYAIFGDTSTYAVVEVSDISSGRLTKTVMYQSGASINSSNIMLSPDETLLYIVGTQGDRVGAAFFDKATGTLSPGCVSGLLKGYVQNWSYVGGLTLATNTGTGDELYIAEFGSPSSIAMVRVSSSAGKCSLVEAPNSPVTDTYSPGLLSIATFPPRSF